MSRILVVGGSGHVGSYLVPKLVEHGHDVVSVSRGTAKPYRPHPAWNEIERVVADRKTEEAAGTFSSRIAALHADIVIDMIAFDLQSVQQLVEALRGKVEHYLFCSSIWAIGHQTEVPATEAAAKNPIDTYGINKAKIEDWLAHEARRKGFPATSFRPGHIVGEGWVPTSPMATSNPDAYSSIARGEQITLPNLGLETLHHVHADDVAHWILCAIENRTATTGEIFNTASPQALTMRGYAEAMFQWFGLEPKIAYQPFEQFLAGLKRSDAENAWGHVMRSTCVSIEKSRRLLGYQPRYSSLQAIKESVVALIASGKITVPPENVQANAAK